MSVSLVDGGASVCLPGLVNAHSHAFHRAIRGVSETRSGDFWTWRSLMYSVADRLDPDSYRELATYVFAEMVLAGWTTVGEFHYLHRGPGGAPYDDPNEMTWALVGAAEAVGIRMTLLDTCYLQGGVAGEPLEGPQRRFSDGDGDAWSRRVSEAAERWPANAPARLGAAIHSVRAVPVPAMGSVSAWAAEADAPLHVHVSEQHAENAACLTTLHMTPTEALHSAGALSARTTAVHATHLSPTDVTRLGFAGCSVCACPTTERDLGDGVGPFAELVDSGAVMCVGSDSHAVIDPFEEMRSLEWHQRLVEQRRGVMTVEALLEAGSAGGARSLGWSADEMAGDSVVVRLDRSPGLSGPSTGNEESGVNRPGAGSGDAEGGRGGQPSDALTARVLFGAAPSDVDRVTIGGTVVVEGGEHVTLGPRRAIAQRLSLAISAVLR